MSIALKDTMRVRLVRLGCVIGVGSIGQLSCIVCLKISSVVINGMVAIDVGIEIVTNICGKKSPYTTLRTGSMQIKRH